MLFEEAFEEYKIYAKKRHKKQCFNVLLYNFIANILSYFKDFKIEDITSLDIEKWQDLILTKNFCNNYNRSLFSMLKDYFNFCHNYYNLDIDFFSKVDNFPLKYEEKKEDHYTLKEFKKFIRYVDNIVYKRFFELMFYCGTRPGEAMALKFCDLRDDYIIINKTIDEHGNRSIGTPKTLSSNRKITIDKKLKRDLLALKNLYCDCTDDYFLFGGVKPLAPTTINRYKLKACDKAHIRPITLHQFRHSHATFLYNKKIDIHVISKRLGHSNISTTLNIYTHSNLVQEKKVLKTLNSCRFNVFSVLLYIFKN